MLPDTFISLSVDVLPRKLEYERTSTTVINAYVGPPVKHYVRSMVSQVRGAGIGGRRMGCATLRAAPTPCTQGRNDVPATQG